MMDKEKKLVLTLAGAVVVAFLLLGIYFTQQVGQLGDKVVVGLAGLKNEVAGTTTYVEGGGLTSSSITSAHIVDGTIAASDLGTDAVTTAKILDGTILSADIEDSLIHYKTVTLASASFGELATTSLELLARPAVGYVNQLVSATGYRVFSSESWTGSGASGAPTIGYAASTSKGFAITASLSKGFFSGGLNTTVASPSYVVVNPAIAYSAASNSAVVLRRAITTAEPAIDGDTYFKFDIFYRILYLTN